MVKYPTGSLTHYTKDQTDLLHPRKQKHRKDVVFSDRGMSLEQQINESNKYYLLEDIAVVHKKPTPVQIVKVDYPKRSRAVIKELTSGKLLQLTIMAYIKDAIWTLKLRKREIRACFL